MSWKPIYCIYPLLLCNSVYGLVEHKIDEKKPLTIQFSKTSHNRISVERGSVEKIFGDESYFNINIDRTTGNAFVTVLRDIPDPMTLTVVTNAGLIQDLAIASTDKLSEHLILKEEEDVDELIAPPSNFHGPTIEFLNKLLEGKSPLGYGQRALNDKDILKLPHPLSASPIKAFEGPFENVLVFNIKNAGKDPIIINSETLKKDNASWVFLNAHELNAKEQVLCIISFPKSEN